MIEKKKIELPYGQKGWVFHIINDIEKLLEQYGMGDIRVEDGKIYFEYDDCDDIIELVKKYLGEPVEENDNEMWWICSSWAPMSFDVIWNKKEGYGIGYGDFKFKTVKDWNFYVREFYRYKRQNKQNSELREKQNIKYDIGIFIAYNIAQFALTYCDYTDEERDKINNYWNDIKKRMSELIVPTIVNGELIFEENKNESIS